MQTTADVAIRTSQIGKKYGSFWALKNCTITVPKGSVCALVGPNGAGKTTLLKLLSSLNMPSEGEVMALGRKPAQHSDYLADIGYVAQEIPLYKHLTAAQHFAMGAHMNSRWDGELAHERLAELHIPLNKSVGKLSGGQRAQVGLAMALAKRPKLLLLDEPVAALDPLARVEFLSSLAQAAADAADNLTIIMSSHLLADLERVCDYMVILNSGQTQLCDSIEHVLKTHRVLVGNRDTNTDTGAFTIVKQSHSASQTSLLVCMKDPKFRDKKWHVRDAELEEIVLAYMGRQETEAGASR